MAAAPATSRSAVPGMMVMRRPGVRQTVTCVGAAAPQNRFLSLRGRVMVKGLMERGHIK